VHARLIGGTAGDQSKQPELPHARLKSQHAPVTTMRSDGRTVKSTRCCDSGIGNNVAIPYNYG
jgi:hypothetical protein